MLKIHAEPPPEYGEKVFSCQIQSDLSLKTPLMEQILTILRGRGFLDQEDEVWSRLCLDEVLINAIKHGNNEDKAKKVTISLFIDKDIWAIRVEDEGEGFSPKDVPTTASKEYYELDHGRGILLMQNYMDEIWYFDRGTRVQLKKFKKNRLRKFLDTVLVFLKLK